MSPGGEPVGGIAVFAARNPMSGNPCVALVLTMQDGQDESIAMDVRDAEAVADAITDVVREIRAALS